MSTKPLPQSASEWIVALQEEPGDEALCFEHRRWLACSESNRRDWEETQQLWRLMAMTLPAHTEEWGQPGRFSHRGARPLRGFAQADVPTGDAGCWLRPALRLPPA